MRIIFEDTRGWRGDVAVSAGSRSRETEEGGACMSKAQTPDRRELISAFALFFVCSLAAMFFCGAHSPFYRYFSAVDSGVYLSVARAMQNGLFPYRDVFDHKGILLYLLYFIAGVISPRGTTGVYLLSGVSFSIFLFFEYRIARIFLSRYSAFAAALILFLPSVFYIVLLNGDGSTEALFMPCLAGCLYYLIRSARFVGDESGEDTKALFSGAIVTGFLNGAMLWIKFSLVPAVAAAFIVLLAVLFARKKARAIPILIFGVLIGVLLVSIPCLLYLFRHDLWSEMWAAYVVFNYQYSGDAAASDHSRRNVGFLISALPMVVFSIAGIVALFRKTDRTSRAGLFFAALLLTLTATSLLIAGRYYPYYFLVLLPFLIFAVIPLVPFLIGKFPLSGSDPRRKRRRLVVLIVAVLLGSVLVSTIRWPNGSSLFPKTETERAAEAILAYREARGEEDPAKLLSLFTQETALGELCETYPQLRYFYRPVMTGDRGEQIENEQIRYVAEGSAEFILIYEGAEAVSWVTIMNPDYHLIFSGEKDSFRIYALEKE